MYETMFKGGDPPESLQTGLASILESVKRVLKVTTIEDCHHFFPHSRLISFHLFRL